MAEYTINKFTYNGNTYKIRDTVSGYGSAANWLNGTGTGSVYTIGANCPTSNYSVAEGYNTWANGNYSHAEGRATYAIGNSSHTEGQYTEAIGDYSHAEGYYTHANGNYSHTEGYYTCANGNFSHAEEFTWVNGEYSHAEGYQTHARGNYSHTEGYLSIANYDYQTVIGKYNNINSENAFEIGWGTETSRRNIFQVETNGAVSFYLPYNNTFFVGTHTVQSAYALNAGAILDTNTTVTKSGWYPLGVVGWECSGSTSTYANIIDLDITPSAGSAKIYYSIRNLHASSQMSLTFKVFILWVRMI